MVLSPQKLFALAKRTTLSIVCVAPRPMHFERGHHIRVWLNLVPSERGRHVLVWTNFVAAINLSLTLSVMKTTVCASLVPVPVGGHLVGVRVWLNFVPSKCCLYVHVCLNLVPSKREHRARLWLVWVPSKLSVSYLASGFVSLWFLFLWGVTSFACG